MKTLVAALVALLCLSNAALAQQSPYQSNCEDVKKFLSGIFPVIEWGPVWGCRAPNQEVATADASLACWGVLGNHSPVAWPGHTVILNWVDVFGIPVFLPSTYLGYCTGLPPAPGVAKRSFDQPRADEAKKKIQDALDALVKK